MENRRAGLWRSLGEPDGLLPCADNQVGLHFNSTGQSVSDTRFHDNRFESNGTAVLLENVPTDITMDFAGTSFTGNGTDINNRCDQPLDVSQAVFD